MYLPGRADEQRIPGAVLWKSGDVRICVPDVHAADVPAALQRAVKLAKEEGMIVFTDRSIWGNFVFAALQREKGNITQPEWETYLSVLREAEGDVVDAVVYLDCDPHTCYERMHRRGTASEQTGAPLVYLQELERAYAAEAFLHMHNRTSYILPLSWDKFGSATAILDKVVEHPEFTVTGDVTLIASGDRRFRAEAFRQLMETHSVLIEAQQCHI